MNHHRASLIYFWTFAAGTAAAIALMLWRGITGH